MTGFAMKTALLALVAGGGLLASGCELGPKEVKQTGYRGAGLAQVTDVSRKLPDDNIPAPPYELTADAGGPRASEVYQNVPVLGNLSADEFNYMMIAITSWIAPEEQGCNYCHNPENMASDEIYTKVVARKMIQMTQNVNSNWANHVKQTGVTCYTCHRGNAVPKAVWTTAAAPGTRKLAGNKRGQNTPDPNVGYASLPLDNYSAYLQGKSSEIRVASSKSLPDGKGGASLKDTEATYGLMMHLSSALGVNCTYCHNSQSFRSWNASTPQRALAYYGIRMVRDINEGYITPLTSVFPANRLGPAGDPYKVNCATCHQGKNKPLGGVSMIADYPALKGPIPAAAPAPAPAPAAEAPVTAEAAPMQAVAGQ
jgi:photosynthetic reaction center cytochrome c subunit